MQTGFCAEELNVCVDRTWWHFVGSYHCVKWFGHKGNIGYCHWISYWLFYVNRHWMFFIHWEIWSLRCIRKYKSILTRLLTQVLRSFIFLWLRFSIHTSQSRWLVLHNPQISSMSRDICPSTLLPISLWEREGISFVYGTQLILFDEYASLCPRQRQQCKDYIHFRSFLYFLQLILFWFWYQTITSIKRASFASIEHSCVLRESS